MPAKRVTYKQSGVNIDAANTFIGKIKPLVKTTERPEVLSTIGHYAGLFQIPVGRYREPVLVASTDGVGTKLKLAIEDNRLEGLGQDLVAMSANDLICVGAEPLFFLDYYATGRLEVGQATALIRGITRACREIHCTLLGGETAEMPNLYRPGDFDLAGFVVGIVEKDQILDGRSIVAGDRIVGLASSGFHSNGYSLVREIIRRRKLSLRKTYAPLKKPLGNILLQPTRLYVTAFQKLRQDFELHGLAHITGGGLLENLPRILPPDCRALLHESAWKRPTLFDLFQKWGPIARDEMHRVFNCGIGLMIVVPGGVAEAVVKALSTLGHAAWVIGEILERRKDDVPIEIL